MLRVGVVHFKVRIHEVCNVRLEVLGDDKPLRPHLEDLALALGGLVLGVVHLLIEIGREHLGVEASAELGLVAVAAGDDELSELSQVLRGA